MSTRDNVSLFQLPKDVLSRIEGISNVEKEFEKLYQDLLWEKVDTNSSKKWQPIHEEKNIKVYKHATNKIFTFKSYFFFENLDYLILHMLSCDTNSRPVWDNNFMEEKVVEKLNEYYDVVYIQLRSPVIAVANRDNCMLRWTKLDPVNKCNIVILKSCDHPLCPVRKDFVRMKTHYHGFIIEQMEIGLVSGCHIFVYSKQDFGGYIPKFIVNLVSKSKPKQWYDGIRNAAQLRSKL